MKEVKMNENRIEKEKMELSLTEAVNGLNKSLQEANNFLRETFRIPANIPLLKEDKEQHYLVFKKISGKWSLGFETFDSSLKLINEGALVNNSKLTIRLKAAELIPDLVKALEESHDNYIQEMEETTKELNNYLKNLENKI